MTKYKIIEFLFEMSYIDIVKYYRLVIYNMKKRTLIERIKIKVNKSKKNTFLLKDFDYLIKKYDYDQILRGLRTLIKADLLVKISRGIYAKTKILSDGSILLNKGINELATEALNNLGIKTASSNYFMQYKNGKTTQIPTGRVIAVNKRVRRKIGYNGNYIKFEKMKIR